MKLKQAVLAAASLLASGVVLAQAAATAPEPDYTASVNVGVVSDYRYRGISQSRLKPALQAGADFAHKSGFYIGTWGSSIKWIEDAGGDANMEVDLYGGYKFNAGPVAVDVGALRYFYPSSSLPVNPDTTELYVAGTYGPATLKYSHAVTNLFGFADSKNSYYIDLNATFDTGFWGLTFVPHIGYQRVSHNSSFSYTDWSLGLGKDFGNGLSASLAYVDTNANGYLSPSGKDLGKATAVLGLKYTYSF
ncbi:TorF family putative porin [Ramlibacter sp. XY19]|uniref:TorF family putative porin n=1 Tax=Ramlibacter paludis TaxID=2908000 RepID=UPI0023DB33C6|nr:TorF family putative porin [Ramlibacter paludis]MCG2594490.1 TorF family putative porin [Ramlibacter paludis]